VEREYIGIDLHKVFFHGCAMTATGERRWEQRWPTSDVGSAALLARCGSHSHLVVEASSPTWAFVDRVVGQVGAIHVVDTRKTRIKAGYAAKTDRLDAQRLADALRRDSVVGIYYPPPAIRDLRELGRYRCHRARLQASVKQRIRALLLRQGVVTPTALFTQRGTTWLDRLVLEGWAGSELRGLRAVLADVRRQLVPVLTAIRTVAATDPIAEALDRLPGFGPVFSVTVRAEVGTIARFPDGPHLASYAGLVPRVYCSGGHTRMGQVCGNVNRNLKWACALA
jgi:transposase